MRKFLLLASLILVFNASGFSQEGHFYLTNHVPRSVTFENTNFKIVQNSHGILFIANNRGLISYDGRNWDFIETPEAVFSLAIDSEDQIFIGGQKGFGILKRIVRNEFQYESLSDSLVSANEVFDIREHLGKIYFMNQKTVFIYDGNSIQELRLKDAAIFRTLAPVPNDMLAITSNGRVFSTANNLTPFEPGIGYEYTLEASFLSPDRSKAILIDSGGNIFLSENGTVSKLEFTDAEILIKLVVTSGVWLEEDIIAIGSLERGVIFLDFKTKSLLEVLNYDSGLPDNQIFSMTRDRVDNSLWISHSYGFSRVSPFLPFRSYGRFPGISGKLLTGYFGNDQIYVGTSVGLYRLEQISEFRDKIIYVPITVTTRTPGRTQAPLVTQEEDDQKNSRRGLLGLFRRKDDSPKEEQQKERPAETTRQEVRLQKRIIQEETAKRWEYKKIQGIDSKVLRLLGTPDGLIAASLSGLFEIVEGQEVPISSEPFTFAYYLEDRKGVIAASANGGVYYFTKSENGWLEHQTFAEVEEFIQYIFRDSKNRIWFLGANVVYMATMFQDEIMNLEFWPIENPYYSNNIGSEINGQVYIHNSAGLYMYNETTKVIEKREMTTLWQEFPERTLSGLDGTIWIYDGKDWSPLGSPTLPSRKVKPISLFNDVSFLNYDKTTDSFWIITGENDLYKMSNKDTIVRNHLPLMLREVRNGPRFLALDGQIEIQQNQNSMAFNFLKPDYDNLFKIEYRYRLAGLDGDWSEWSSDNNSVSFPFLPEGDYVLNFESRDVFGQVNSMEPFEFKIIPPYWKRPWFYGIEIVAFGGLFFLSIFLNRIDHKYKFLSRLLAFLTLILAVEFIQIIAEMRFPSAETPVTGFFIQVFIALILLPIEGVVRKAVFRMEEAGELKSLKKKGS